MKLCNYIVAFVVSFSAIGSANAATYDYSAETDICGPGSLDVTLQVGDTLNISDTQATCTSADVTEMVDRGTFAFIANGADTIFQVVATSAGIGTGTVTWTGGALLTITVVAAATTPGAPTGVSATAGDAQATVSWTQPSDDGGAAITSYTVTGSPNGSCATPDGSTTSCTVTGLTNLTEYTFTVAATNSAGSGAGSSASNAVTPARLQMSGGGSTVSIPSGSGSLTSFAPVSETPPAGLVESVVGAFSFAANVSSGSSLTVTIDLGTNIPAGTKAYKVSGSAWTEITTATFGATTVIYTVTDNGALDQDATAGVIQDPVALAVPAAAASVSPTAIPALPLWALWILGGLAGLLGVNHLREHA
ncbi:fibronectin type III domain-containing protein [Congregibacter variabilis]|uniref:Fibronectin type III domain-containing protein n=1 Tax=Congregibacter variabilis TaxID=3081200 RepID=A0ABZ0I095_9GAMM|nr:fibronectin type III domain-containing protein [Congregibacter sp. IMCC43200]